LRQAEEARRSMTEQLAAAAAEAALEEAALETALQHRQVELEDARAELGAVSSAAQIASSLLAAEIGGLEAQCEHKVRHSRELAMSWRRECDEAEAAAALGTVRAEAAAREAEAALETARIEAAAALGTARAEVVALRTALERERQGASEREQRAARDLDEMTSSRLELQMTISRLEHQLTEQRQQLTEQLTQSEREWSEGTALLRAQLELEWRSHLAHEIAEREAAAQAALELAVGESGTDCD
jgi:hypothetical protein